MVKKLFALLSTMALFMLNTATVVAAPAELPITLSNSWTVSENGGGNIRIPYLIPEIIQ
ncbi:MAG: hypothetical protein NC548_29465 [Lachnospiraceae bacterium]|nr:hypothetical protein [Lachnospiraceae bacterium]